MWNFHRPTKGNLSIIRVEDHTYHGHEDDQPSCHSPWTQKSKAYLHFYNRKPQAEANWDVKLSPTFSCAHETLRTQRISWAEASLQPLEAHLKVGPYKTTQSCRRPELPPGPSTAPPSQRRGYRPSRTAASHFLLSAPDIGPFPGPIDPGLLSFGLVLPPITEPSGGGSGGTRQWRLPRRFRRWLRWGCTTSLGTYIGSEAVHINPCSL